MLTTLYCDASFCPRDRVGGWAIWLRSEEGRHIESGPVPEYCNVSNEAELAAIYAGIYRAITLWGRTEAILVRSDCTAALHWMEQRYEAPTEGGRRLQLLIRRLHDNRMLSLIPRWVKGHQGGDQTEAWLNRRVDRMARKVMQLERLKT